jgi:hypothetical protein
VKTFTDNFDHFLGDVVNDPFAGIDPKTELRFQPGVFVPNDPPGVYPVFNLAHYNGILLSVHFWTDHWSRVEGSAVLIAPRIAITAAHVLDDHFANVIEGAKRMLCVGYTPDGPLIWRVPALVRVENTELMILCLDLASSLPASRTFHQAAITTRLPSVGETVMIAGFRASDENISWDEDQDFVVKDNHIEYGMDLRIGVGEVKQQFLTGRGSALPGPTIEVACSTPGGVIGGSAFDKNGRVFGVLSRSFDHEDGRGPSYVSMLVPALARQIVPTFRPASPVEPIRLIDCALCDIERRDAVRWSITEDGLSTRIEWDEWTDPQT